MIVIEAQTVLEVNHSVRVAGTGLLPATAAGRAAPLRPCNPRPVTRAGSGACPVHYWVCRSVRASRCLPGWRIGQPTWGVTPVAVRLGNPEGLGARVPSIINVQCHSSRQELDWSAHDDICPQKGTSRSMLYS